MTLTSLLRPDRINLDLKAKKKPEALRELVQMIRQGDELVFRGASAVVYERSAE